MLGLEALAEMPRQTRRSGSRICLFRDMVCFYFVLRAWCAA
jgi:hypothetical protein